MKIRAGYEISYDCAQSTPMIAMLSVHPSRLKDLMTPDLLHLDQLPLCIARKPAAARAKLPMTQAAE
jgi:hypothetical protein